MMPKGCVYLSQWDKLIEEILRESPDLRFEDLAKALIKSGYEQNQPRGGSSHYTFRKKGCKSITIPKQSPMKKVYIKLVSEAVKASFEEAVHE